MSYIVERRDEEKERRRLEIIEAAEGLYAERGWDAVTMDQVARAARLSRALVYVYFKDKDDLLLAIASRAMQRMAERFRHAAMTHPRGIDKVRAIGHAYIAFAGEFPHYFDAETRFQAHRAGSGGTATEHACVLAADGVHAVMLDVLEQAMADGSVRRDIGDPNLVCMALWAFAHGLVRIATAKADALEAHGVPLAEFVDGSVAMVSRMLEAGAKS